MKPIEYQPLIKMVHHVSGDLAEIGLNTGSTFRGIVSTATSLGVDAHGFDSFEGMAEPGPRDGPAYPKGRFANSMDKVASTLNGNYKLFKGFIPVCFSEIASNQKYRFLYLDVDHYEPTKIALVWAWDHMTPGGLLLLDDWFEGGIGLASGAINEWIEQMRLNKDALESIPLPKNMAVKNRLCFRKI